MLFNFTSKQCFTFSNLLDITSWSHFSVFSTCHIPFTFMLLQKSVISSYQEINTLTANYEYSRSNRGNLPLPIQMQLSEKPNIFCQFFIAFLEFSINYEHFEKEMSLIAQVFAKLLTPKDVLTSLVRSCFWKPFGSERVKLWNKVEFLQSFWYLFLH